MTHAGAPLAEEVVWARGWRSRARGLIGWSLPPERALILQPASQVHTFFMSQPIDVVFCDRNWVVLHVISPMPTWRVSKWVRGSRYVVELNAGAAAAIRPGDTLGG